MNFIKYYLFVCSVLSSSFIFSQSTDPVLMKINGTPVYKSEFEYAYNKDLDKNSKQSFDEFLQSYINFKLNIEEAKHQGLDRRKSFINEYSNYLEQLEKPYLTDSISPEIVGKDVYNKLKENIEVSHILIRFPKPISLPQDTIDAYQQALNIRKSVTKKQPISFEELASKYSQDTLSIYSRTPGYVGWKTIFTNPYAYDKAMYSTPIGSISNPVRTDNGYYLIKVHNKRADLGQIQIAHILLRYPAENPTQHQKDSLKNLAQTIYKDLQAGANFDELCTKYSFDRASAQAGGNLGWFGVHRPLPPNLEPILFGIQEIGALTKPVELDYGYHIFKLLDKMPLLPWESLRENITKAINESERKGLVTAQRINTLSKEYPYSVNQDCLNKLSEVSSQYNLSDTLFFNQVLPHNETNLIRVGNDSYKVEDFISFMEKNPYSYYTLSTDILSSKVNEFILDCLINTKKNNLLKNNSELRNISQEFYEGILYFDIMNKEVWGKAHQNKAELHKLFNENRDKYTWDSPRYKGYVIHARDKNTIKKVQNVIKKNKGAANIQQILNKEINTDSISNIKIEKGLWAKGENPFVDKILYNTKLENEIIGFPEYIIEGRQIASPDSFDDIQGQVISDYQSLLEKEWIETLQSKYKVEINQDILQSIKKQ